MASLKDIICTGVIRCLNKVYASEFIGKLKGNADSATKATQDESGNNIKSSYASSIGISDHTITLKNKNGASLGTVTVPDNNTWRGIQNNLTSDSTTDSLSAAQGKALKALVDGKANSSHTHSNYLTGITKDMVTSALGYTPGKGVHVGATSPKDTTMIWIDTANGGILKYYNGTTWVTTVAVWG